MLPRKPQNAASFFILQNCKLFVDIYTFSLPLIDIVSNLLYSIGSYFDVFEP